MAYKKIAFLMNMLVSFCNLPINARNVRTTINTGTHSIHPNNTVFLWDLHGVIFKKDIKDIFKIVWRYEHTWDILRNTDRSLLSEMAKLAYRALFEEGLGETSIILANQHNNQFLAELIIKTTNAQKPIEPTIAIIKALHEHGYRHHIGSNISATTFKQLIDPKKYPQFAHIFKYFDLDKSHVTSGTDTSDVKPHPEYFKNYLTQNNIDLNHTTVIFIDNRKSNVEAARTVGMIGIQFKSPRQLRKDLHTLGIIIDALSTQHTTSPICNPA